MKIQLKQTYRLLALAAAVIAIYISLRFCVDIAMFSSSHSASATLVHIRIHAPWVVMKVLSIVPIPMLCILMERLEKLQSRIDNITDNHYE